MTGLEYSPQELLGNAILEGLNGRERETLLQCLLGAALEDAARGGGAAGSLFATLGIVAGAPWVRHPATGLLYAPVTEASGAAPRV